LMAGIDLLTGHVHALLKERHRSREFIEFLKLLGRSRTPVEKPRDEMGRETAMKPAIMGRETTWSLFCLPGPT